MSDPRCSKCVAKLYLLCRARHFPALGILTKRMDGSRQKIEFFAGDNDQPLKGRTGHGTGSRIHALGQRLRRTVVAATGIGEEQQWVTMESPVAAQLLPHGSGQRDNTVLVAFAVADEQFVFGAFDIVNGEPETLA
jgi:hypothetical protein